MTTRRLIIPDDETTDVTEPSSTEVRETATEVREDRDPLEEAERVTPIMGEEFDEEELEEEEIAEGENRDVIQDVPGLSGHDRVLPTQDQLPEGMETAVRGSEEGDEEEIRTQNGDEETGGVTLETPPRSDEF